MFRYRIPYAELLVGFKLVEKLVRFNKGAMKLLLMSGGVFVLAAMLASGQSAPVTKSEPGAGTVAGPAAVTQQESGNRPRADLDSTPPPPATAGPQSPAVQSPAPKPEKAVNASGPGANGPPVVDAPAGPVILPEAAAAGTPPAAGRGPGRGATPARNAKPYVIGPLDVLEVRVWNDAKLSGMVDVATDGTITLPLVGPVVASGLTVAELTLGLKDKLTNIIIEPEVTIQVLRINSKKYSIFGGCLRSGEFPLVGDVTVLDAFASCGGFKDFANLKKIYVLRGTEKPKFNYQDVIRGKHMEQNILLENGDRIVVPD
jgi:polysaccharide export outer membrane protein